MKRIILSMMVLAFAVAVQADDTKTKQTKDAKPACCASKTKVSDTKEEGGCPFAKAACCDKKDQAKKDTAKQPVLLSPKASDTAK
jgi:hypothetical protein